MKLIASLIAAAAMALTMLVAVPTTATAAPYPGTVATSCSYAVPGSVRKNRKLNVAYRVRASGNARPSGVVLLRVYRKTNGGYKFIRGFAQRYTGPVARRTSLGKFKKKGSYATFIAFRPNSGSVYKASTSGLRSFRVTRR